jgi:hypothetical protein
VEAVPLAEALATSQLALENKGLVMVDLVF